MTALQLKNYLQFVEKLYDLNKIDVKFPDGEDISLTKTEIHTSGNGRFTFTLNKEV